MTEKKLPLISLDQPYGILSAALVILSHFSDTLVTKIDSNLSKLFGGNWKKKLQDDGLLPTEFNTRDPQAVLKELARNGSSQFRIPLNSQIPREKLSFFYNGLDDLLGERNAWVHRQIDENMSELKDLALTTSNLLLLSSLEFDYLGWIEELSTSTVQFESMPSTDSVEMVPSTAKAEVPEERFEMNNDEEGNLTIGSPISSRFLAHSYVLEANGDISDRNTGVKISEFNSKYQRLIKGVISDLKVGSRLRITQEGQLCAFFEDHWGFLTKIDPSEWFPNHLK